MSIEAIVTVDRIDVQKTLWVQAEVQTYKCFLPHEVFSSAKTRVLLLADHISSPVSTC